LFSELHLRLFDSTKLIRQITQGAPLDSAQSKLWSTNESGIISIRDGD
jgi:hypothetical protein